GRHAVVLPCASRRIRGAPSTRRRATRAYRSRHRTPGSGVTGFSEVEVEVEVEGVIMASDAELQHLRRCVELAAEALEAGDQPFGSVLVAADGTVLAEDRNRVASGDATRHPESELARWAASNMTPPERAAATVFTSGEHCPM